VAGRIDIALALFAAPQSYTPTASSLRIP